MRRLFEIYAQQRTRFAEELREYLPTEETSHASYSFAGSLGGMEPECEGDSLRECLEIDSRTLELYKETLAHRTLPTRAHFLISSQLALMQRVHDRVNVLLDERGNAGSCLHRQGISA